MIKGKKNFKTINFYEVYMYDPEKVDKKKTKRLIIIPIVIFVLLLIATFAFFFINNIMIQKDIDELKDYLEDGTNLSNYNAVLKLQDERDTYTNKYNELESTRYGLEQSPKVSSKLNQDSIGKTMNSEIVSIEFDAKDGTVIYNLITSSVKNVPDIVDNLQEIGSYSDVDYYGYKSDDGQTYNLVATCKLKS